MASGDRIAGKYELEVLIARGGMGSVWRARHLSLDTHVAVKLMSAALASSPAQQARFVREAKAAAQLRSPHVVQIHDHGVEGETPYIVMELLSGEDLGARLRREGRLSPEVTASFARQICRGLRRAHELGIVHRDLKPANIFLARTDDDEELVKILDFGIARAGVTGDCTLTGEMLGSPPYMSPEQVRGLKSLDHRTDQWSFGVVLYRMLSGRLPFLGDQPGDVIVKVCTEAAPLFSSVAPDLPLALDPFFRRVLNRDPSRRFVSVREMVDAFLDALRPDLLARSSSNPPEAPVIPYVPVGRTTARLDAPLRPGPRGAPVPTSEEVADSSTVVTSPAGAVSAAAVLAESALAESALEESARAESVSTVPTAAVPVDAAPNASGAALSASSETGKAFAAAQGRPPESFPTSRIVALHKTAPPAHVWRSPAVSPFSGAPPASRRPDASTANVRAAVSFAIDATTASGTMSRSARPAVPSVTKPATWGAFWVGLIILGALLGTMTALVIRTAGRSASPLPVVAAPATSGAPRAAAPTGTGAGRLPSAVASAETAPTGTLPTGTLPTGMLPTGTLPTGTFPTATLPAAASVPGKAAARAPASASASAAPGAEAAPSNHFIYPDSN